MTFELIRARAQGASHIKAGTPCEDFGLVDESEFGQVFVVSDGHGDKSCPRSDIGSQMACQIACRELLTFASDLSLMQLSDLGGSYTAHPLCRNCKDFTFRTMRQLVSSIIGKWSNAVLSELAENPLTKDELDACSPRYRELYERGERLEHIYGATLIAGLLTNDYLILLQQGDGRCILFDSNGIASQPIPWDDRCTANITTSLCDSDAIESTRFAVLKLSDSNFCAVFSGSDGVEDAYFSMEQTFTFYRELLVRIASTSVKDTEDYLTGFLPEFSAKGTNGYGSQDDVTICGLVDYIAVTDLKNGLLLDAERATIMGDLKSVEDRLASASSGKREYLERRFSEAEREYQTSTTEYESTLRELQAYKDDLEIAGARDADIRLTARCGNIIRAVSKQSIALVVRFLTYSLTSKIGKLNAALPALKQSMDETEVAYQAAKLDLDEYIDRVKGLMAQRDTLRARLAELNQSRSTQDMPSKLAYEHEGGVEPIPIEQRDSASVDDAAADVDDSKYHESDTPAGSPSATEPEDKQDGEAMLC